MTGGIALFHLLKMEAVQSLYFAELGQDCANCALCWEGRTPIFISRRNPQIAVSDVGSKSGPIFNR